MKRKINDEPTDQTNSKSIDAKQLSSGTTAKQTTSKAADDPVFKVPEIPRKMRKLQKTATPKIDPAIIANAEVINKMVSPEKTNKSPPPTQRSTARNRPAAADIVSPPKRLNTKTDDQNENIVKAGQDAPFDALKTVPLTEMGALLNAVVEKNTRKVTDYVRTSLEGMLHEFWDTTKPTQQLQKLQDQMAAMRSTYGGQIDVLQNKNNTLKQDLDTMNSKYDVQLVKVRETLRENEDLNERLSATKSKMAVLTVDLKKSISK